MSAQSIDNITIGYIAQSVTKIFIDNANKMLLKKRFELGDGYCEFKQRDAEMWSDIIATGDCELFQCIERMLLEEGIDTDSIDLKMMTNCNSCDGCTKH
jgi:hypothetical protein